MYAMDVPGEICHNDRYTAKIAAVFGILGQRAEWRRWITGHRGASVPNLKSRISNLQSGEARRPSYLITVIFFDPAARPLTMI